MSEQASRNERITASAVIFLTFLLRVIYVFRYRFNSDEPQHLHVVWGWAHGLVQYRDVFDNHAPLFHLLCVPLYKMVGDNPVVLFAMRLAMLPLFIMVLWCVFLIGREIYSSRAGLWAAVFTALFSPFFFRSMEFRTDNLWTLLWLLSIVICIRGPLKGGKCFAAGLLLGAAMCVSMKTTLLIPSLAAGALVTFLFSPARYLSNYGARRLCIYGAAVLAGLSVVPAALVLYFYWLGDLGPFFYGTIGHNVFPGIGLWHKFYTRVFIFPTALTLLYGSARIIAGNIAHQGRRARWIFIFFTGGIYVAALKAFWPVLELQHYLPFYPLFVVILTQAILSLDAALIAHYPIRQWRAFLCPGWGLVYLTIFLEVISILALGEGAPWHDRTQHHMQLLRDVLQLTEPSDYVADLKGETIFRQRSPYYILEKITRERIKRGLLTDDIPKRLMATHTCVATLDNNHFPEKTRSFLQQNYISIGKLRVAGKLLQPDADKNSSISFDVRLPASYVVINKTGHVSGKLDGTPYTGARFLQAGHHELHLSAPYHGCALLWERAYERGYSPFI